MKCLDSLKTSGVNDPTPDNFIQEGSKEKHETVNLFGAQTSVQGFESKDSQENLHMQSLKINKKLHESTSNPLDSMQMEKEANNSAFQQDIAVNESIADKNPLESCSESESLREEENAGPDSPLISTTSKTILSALKKPSRQYIEIDDF